MRAGERYGSDPRWGAAAPLLAGMIALVIFAGFIVLWAEQRLILGMLPVQGTLLLPPKSTDLTNARPQNVSVSVLLDSVASRGLIEGQDAVLRLRSPSAAQPLELAAEVTKIIYAEAHVEIRIQPVPREWSKIEALPLLHGSPVEVTILTGDRSVLALLLAPIIAVFSDDSNAASTNGT